ncbi:MAG: histidine--tRNA ligase [Deltaproteobacteria bacterium]|jgi:histidyl-tRNA synthetase|nr:histidine--tRNA ligase [Deltaproteobacteria bacterium]
MAKIETVKGFADHLPEEAARFAFMETEARRVFALYGYREIHVPVLEYTELFARSIGVETDVVRKEMFTFPDRKERSLTLRPEATAGIMRAYVEHGLYTREAVSRLFTFGPMFRYERPQKGRMRQFHQVNCECLGLEEPAADAEIILMLMRYLEALGITEAVLELNTLGCKACRPAYREALKAFLRSRPMDMWCEDCRRRLETNPLRVLDCKNAVCREQSAGAPEIVTLACPDCRGHFAALRGLLDGLGQRYKLNPRLVRGLDYYTRTTFEVVSGAVGAQSSIAGGGRYDGLTAALGGPDAPGIGFACGLERLAMLLPGKNAASPDFYIAVLEDQAMAPALALAQRLRGQGCSGLCASRPSGLKGQLRAASRHEAAYALILGGAELDKGVVMVKDMRNGEQKEAGLEGFSLE